MADAELNGDGGGHRSAIFEKKFKEWNLAYHYVDEMRLDDMRVADWAQVRQGEHVAPKERVEEYAEQQRNGAEFPPLVLMSGQPPVLIDGNTRRSAYQLLRQKACAVYVVDTGTIEMAKILAASLNQMGGERLTSDEAYEAAMLMLERDMAVEAVAREVGRHASRVREWRRMREASERATSLGLRETYERLDRPARLRLSNVAHDLPFAEAVKFVADVKPKPKDLRSMVEEISAATSDDQAVDVIHALRAKLKPAGPPPHRPNVNRDAQLAHGSIGNLLRFVDRPHACVDLTARDAETERWKKLMDLAQAVLGVLGEHHDPGA